MFSSKIIRRAIPLLVLVLFVFLAYRITQTQPAATEGLSHVVPRLVVETQLVESQPFTVDIESFGILQARTTSDLYPLVSGQVMSVTPAFEAGAFFKKDDVLLTINSADYEVAVQVAKSNVANSELALADEQARYEQAQRDWQKQNNKAVATDYALRLPQIRAAQANLETSRAQLALAKLNLERTRIRAPYDGRILETAAAVGSVISPNQKIARVYATDAIEVRLPLANKDLRFIELPEPTLMESVNFPQVQIENDLIEPAEIWLGQVIRTEAAVDPASQQLYVVARVDNPFLDRASKGVVGQTQNKPKHPLKIGQYVRAKIAGKQLRDVMVIPNSSIYQGSYVYIVEHEKIQRRPIEIIWQNQRVSVLQSGLNAGAHLVITLLGQVTSGTLVDERLKVDSKAENMPELTSGNMQ